MNLKFFFLFLLALIIGSFFYAVIPFVFYSVAHGADFSDLTGAVVKQQENAHLLKEKTGAGNIKNNPHYSQMHQRALKSYLKFKKNQIPLYKQFRQQMYGHSEQQNLFPFTPIDKEWKHFLRSDERLYIFMSSSVPLVTWENYAQSLDKLREANAVMVLRGCIGGCQRIRPTLAFLQKIILPHLEEVDFSRPDWQEQVKKKARHVQVWIDPLLFRYYDITEVPCVVFARKVNPYIGASEGYKGNLKNRPQYWKVCGDWRLDYVLEKLYDKSNAEVLKRMVKELRKSWWSSEAKSDYR